MPITSTLITPPRYTTTQRDTLTPDVGLMIYNTTTNVLETWNGSAWVPSGGVGGSGTQNKVPLFGSGGTVVGDSALSQTGNNLAAAADVAASGNVYAASVGVGTGGTVDSKAALEVASTTKGFLPPRLTTTQRDAIVSPTTGLLIFNTTTGVNETWNGTSWVSGSGVGGSGTQNKLPLFGSGGTVLGDSALTQSGSNLTAAADVAATGNVFGAAAGVGTGGSVNSKAALEVASTTKGVLISRMTTTQRDAIAAPPTGLQIYNTTTNQPEFWNGTGWQAGTGIGGSGTQNKVPLFGSGGAVVGDSALTQSGSNLTAAGAVAATTSVTAATAGIGTGGTVDTKAVLDVASTTKGVLIPRMTTTQRDAITSPTEGLQIYNTTTKQSEFYNGTAWTGGTAGIGGSGTAQKIPLLTASTTLGDSALSQSGTDVLTGGALGVGVGSINSKAILDAASTTKGFLPPRMTTTQRDAITSPPAGLSIYNTTLARTEFYNGTSWTAGAVSGINGSGTVTKIPKFSGSTTTLADSLLSESGTLAQVSQNASDPLPIQTRIRLNAKEYAAKSDCSRLRQLSLTASSATLTGPSGTFAAADAGKTLTLFGAAPAAITTISFATSVGGTNGNYTVTCTNSPFVASDVGKRFDIAGAGPGGTTLQTTIVRFSTANTVGVSARAQTNATGTGTIYRDLSRTISTYTSSTSVTLNTTSPSTIAGVTGVAYTTDNSTPIQNALNAAILAGNPATVYLPAGTYKMQTGISLTGLGSTDSVTIEGERGTVLDITGATSSPYINISGSRTLLGTLTTSLNADVAIGSNIITVNLAAPGDLKTGDLIQITSYDQAQALYNAGKNATISARTDTTCTVTLSGNPVVWQTVPVGTEVGDNAATEPKWVHTNSKITANNGAGVLTLSQPLDDTGTAIPCLTTQGGYQNGVTDLYVSDPSLMFCPERPEYCHGDFAEVESVVGTAAPYTVYLRNNVKGRYNASASWNGAAVYRVEAPSVTLKNLTIRKDDIPADQSGPIAVQLQYCRNWSMEGLDVQGGFDRAFYPIRCYNGRIRDCTCGAPQASKSTIYGLAVGSCQNLTVEGCHLYASRRGIDVVGWEPVSDVTFANNTVGFSGYADYNEQNDIIYAFAMHGLTRNINIIGNRILGGIGFENANALVIANNQISNSNGAGIWFYCFPSMTDRTTAGGTTTADLQILGNNIYAYKAQVGISGDLRPAIRIYPYKIMQRSLGSILVANNVIKSDQFGFLFQPSSYGTSGIQFDSIIFDNNDVTTSTLAGLGNGLMFYFLATPPGSGLTAPCPGTVFKFKSFQINGGRYEVQSDSRWSVCTNNTVIEHSGSFSIRGAEMICNRNSAGSNFFDLIGFTKISITDSKIRANASTLVPKFTIGNLSSGASDAKDIFFEMRGNDFYQCTNPAQVVAGTSVPFSGGATAHLASAGDMLFSNNHFTTIQSSGPTIPTGFRLITEYVSTFVSGVPNAVGWVAGTTPPATGTWANGDRMYRSDATGVAASPNYWIRIAGAWTAVNF